MPDLEYCIEGDFVEDHLGNIFEVKGFHQPQDKVVCFIRYYPIDKKQSLNRSKTNQQTNQKQNYQKIYDLSDKIAFINQNYPEYQFKSENYYFPLHAVPIQNILKHYKPELYFKQDNYSIREEASQIQRDTSDFCKFLSDQSHVPMKYFGVTGSTLVGLETPRSDIDIIIYGFDNSSKIRDTIRQIFNKSLSGSEIKAYDIEDLRDHYTFRVPTKAISFYDFLKYESRKLHQGKFRNRDFFIRFLPFSGRLSYAHRNLFSIRRIQSMGRITLRGQVAGDQNWWTTPSELEVTNVKIISKKKLKVNYKDILEKIHLDLSEITSTFSLRGRYTENVKLLELFQARGTLELVQIQNQPPFLQLSLGSHMEDYLISQ